MGGRGSFGGAGKSASKRAWKAETVSLAGYTGTDKQKAYAEDLVEAARLTAQANGVAGIQPGDNGERRYVQETGSDGAEAYRNAYRVYAETVRNMSTYGQVINYARSTSMSGLAERVYSGAQKAGISITEYVDKQIEALRKRLKS